MYNLTKVKRWIKAAAKRNLVYNAEEQLISDSCVLIRAYPNTHPAILEVFGHLEGGQLLHGQHRDAFPLAPMMAPASEEVIDSGLRYTKQARPKKEYRVLYLRKNGEKIIIDQKYAELFKNFEDCTLTTNKTRSPVVITRDYEIIGVIALVIPAMTEDEFLNTFRFTTN